MDKLNAIMVEDEEASRIALRNYIQKYCPTVNLMSEAQNIDEAYAFINQKKPDLIFLDVEMPYGNAFDLLEKFETLEFEIVFVTAYSKYALDALNLSASNYLLKPVDIQKLIAAIKNVEDRIANKRTVHTSNILLENLAIEHKQLKKIVLPKMDGFEVVVLKDIVRCVANDNLTDLFLENKHKITVCKTLKYYENVLKDYDFVRVHKSHLININFVKEYKKGKGGEVILSNGVTVPISSSRKQAFLEKFI